MDKPEFIMLPMSVIPLKIIQQYNLKRMVCNDKIYVRVDKGMYGLLQAGILANELLQKCLDPHGYYQCQNAPGLWSHRWRPVTFMLVVDDFGVKYVGEQHAKHLFTLLRKYYTEVTIDW